MEIEIKMREKYELGKKNEKKGTLFVYLPSDGDGIDKILRDSKTELLGEKLCPAWGYSGPEGWREREKTFYGNWGKIMEQIEDTREEVIKTLKEVIRKNLEKMRTKPDDKEYAVLIVVDEDE